MPHSLHDLLGAKCNHSLSKFKYDLNLNLDRLFIFISRTSILEVSDCEMSFCACLIPSIFVSRLSFTCRVEIEILSFGFLTSYSNTLPSNTKTILSNIMRSWSWLFDHSSYSKLIG